MTSKTLSGTKQKIIGAPSRAKTSHAASGAVGYSSRRFLKTQRQVSRKERCMASKKGARSALRFEGRLPSLGREAFLEAVRYLDAARIQERQGRHEEGLRFRPITTPATRPARLGGRRKLAVKKPINSKGFSQIGRIPPPQNAFGLRPKTFTLADRRRHVAL